MCECIHGDTHILTYTLYPHMKVIPNITCAIATAICSRHAWSNQLIVVHLWHIHPVSHIKFVTYIFVFISIWKTNAHNVCDCIHCDAYIATCAYICKWNLILTLCVRLIAPFVYNRHAYIPVPWFDPLPFKNINASSWHILL